MEAAHQPHQSLQGPTFHLAACHQPVNFRRMKLHAVVHEAEEGGYWVEVPALPGCVTQAETLEELKANLHEAVEGWLLADARD